MTSRHPLLQTALLGALLLVLPDRPLAVAAPPPDVESPKDDHLADVQAVIETAFARGDASALRAALSHRLKAYVGCALLDSPDGYYGPGQVELLLERLFATRTTLRASLRTKTPQVRDDGTVALPLLWRYRREGSAAADAGMLFVLARDGTTWSVREIRDLK